MKGLSSIIVSILLILITVSLALMFYAWGMEISLDFEETSDTITQQRVSESKTSFFITAVSANEIGIKNNGEIPIDMDAFQVYINDTLVNVSSDSDTLGPGNATILTVTSSFTNGNYTIEVSGPYGKYDQVFDELGITTTSSSTTSTSTSSTSTTSTTTTTMIWFSGFDYRTNITIDNTANSNDLQDYQVLVTLESGTFNYTNTETDGSDVWFTDSDGTTEIDYWVESWNYGGTSNIWVEVPNIPASSTKDIYIYYGNSTVSSNSNGDATWVWFQDWTSDYRSEYTRYVAADNKRDSYLKALDIAPPFKYIIRTKITTWVDGTFGCTAPVGFVEEGDDFRDSSNEFHFDLSNDRDNGATSSVAAVSLSSKKSDSSAPTSNTAVPFSMNTYYIFEIYYSTSEISSKWLDDDRSTEKWSDSVTNTNYIPTDVDYHHYSRNWISSGTTKYWDYDNVNYELEWGVERQGGISDIKQETTWSTLGKYSSPEPSASVGVEESY